MTLPLFYETMESTQGLTKKALENFNVAFIGKVSAFNPVKQTVDVIPVVAAQVYTTNGNKTYSQGPMISDIPLCTTGFGSWYITNPVEIGSTVVVLCTDLNFSEWTKRGLAFNPSNTQYHSLNNAIAIAGINSNITSIPNFYPNGLEIRNKLGTVSLKMTEDGLTFSIGGIEIMSITATGIDIKTLDLTIQGTKIFEWLTTHTHSYIAPQHAAGSANTQPAGPMPTGE